MAAQRITFCRFIPDKSFNINKTIEYLQAKSTVESHYTFSEQEDTFVKGCYYQDQPYTTQRFNVDSGEIESITLTHQYSVIFEFNTMDKTLMLWGNRKIVPRLLTEIDIASNNKVAIEEVSINFNRAITRIVKSGNISISKLKITNVPIEKGILATCSVNVVGIESPYTFVTKYVDRITQLTFTVNNDFKDEKESSSINATLYSTGSFVVHKDRENISDEIIEILKSIVA